MYINFRIASPFNKRKVVKEQEASSYSPTQNNPSLRINNNNNSSSTSSSSSMQPQQYVSSIPTPKRIVNQSSGLPVFHGSKLIQPTISSITNQQDNNLIDSSSLDILACFFF